MAVRKTVAVVAVLVVSCSGSKSVPVPAACGVPEDFELSTCDLQSLANLELSGIWNAEIAREGGARSGVSLNFLDRENPLVSGAKVTRKALGGETFFLSSSQVADNLFWSSTFVGCRATSKDEVEGVYRACLNASPLYQGSFRARRLGNPPGEGESKNLVQSGELRPIERSRSVDVTVEEGFAYLSQLTNGLSIVDIRNPFAPRRVATLSAQDDTFETAFVRGGALYVGTVRRGILLFDVSNKAEPRFVKTVIPEAVEIRSFAADGNVLFAASPRPSGQIFAIDIADAIAPVVRARHQVEGAQVNTGAYPRSVHAQGGRLAVSHGALGLVLLDVTNLDDIKELGRYTKEISRSETTLLFDHAGKKLAFHSDELGGSEVLDVTNPAAIAVLGSYSERPFVPVRRAAWHNGSLFLAKNQDGVRVIDLQNPAAPVERAFFNTWSEGQPERGQGFYEGASAIQVTAEGAIFVAETERGLMTLREP